MDVALKTSLRLCLLFTDLEHLVCHLLLELVQLVLQFRSGFALLCALTHQTVDLHEQSKRRQKKGFSTLAAAGYLPIDGAALCSV